MLYQKESMMAGKKKVSKKKRVPKITKWKDIKRDSVKPADLRSPLRKVLDFLKDLVGL